MVSLLSFCADYMNEKKQVSDTTSYLLLDFVSSSVYLQQYLIGHLRAYDLCILIKTAAAQFSSLLVCCVVLMAN